MVVNDLPSLILQVGKIGLLLQALGVIVILWIIFEAISLYYSWKRSNEVIKIKGDMKRIEDKLDKLTSKK